MPRMDLYNLGSIGVILDKPGHLLSPEAWTAVKNMHFDGESVNNKFGHIQAYNPASGGPEFIMPVHTPSQFYWLYMTKTKGYCISSTTHTDITRTVGGDYATNEGEDWNGCVFQGIPIVNNGTNAPQFWNNPGVGTDLANLTNWPANTTAKVIRAYKNFLIALNLTESSTAKPHRIRWSDAADPGSLPSSWDYTVATNLSGARDLNDPEAGGVVDGLQLQDAFVIYKEHSTWVMRFIGGELIYSTFQFSNSSGILSARCVTYGPNGTSHFVVTRDDVVLFDLREIKSIVDDRVRKELFNDIDPASVAKCFTFTDRRNSRIYLCYPSAGSSEVNKAMIWNWKFNTFTFEDFIGNCASIGPIELSEDSVGWDSSESEVSWNEYQGRWSQNDTFSDQDILVGYAADVKFFKLDFGLEFDGAPIRAYVERIGLPFTGRDRMGNPKADLKVIKQVTRLWPKIVSGPLNIRVGVQDKVDGPVAWTDPITYNPDNETYIDLETPVAGRLISFRFETNGNEEFRIDGIDYEFNIIGEFMGE